MITIVARFKIQPGREEEAGAALEKMAAVVEANEPGALMYLLHRSKQDILEVTIFEAYADQAAIEAHGRTPHMGEFRAQFSQLADPASFKVEQMEQTGGFVRLPA